MGFQSAQLFIIIYSQLFVAGLATTTHYIVPRQKNNKKKHDTTSVCPVKIVSKSGLQKNPFQREDKLALMQITSNEN